MAFGLRSQFTHGHATALVDCCGHVLDLTVFSRAENTIDAALGWAGCFAANDGTTGTELWRAGDLTPPDTFIQSGPANGSTIVSCFGCG